MTPPTPRFRGHLSTTVVGCVLAAAAVVAPFGGPLAGLAPSAGAAPAASAAYVALQPCRLTDTRKNSGFSRLDALTLLVATAGACAVPAGATALALTLTVIDPPAAGFLTAWPANQSQPTASGLNFKAHQIRANGSITRVAADGSFKVFTNVPTDVVIDVVGAFVPATTAKAGRFTPTAPTRIHDSRPANKVGVNATFTLPLPAGVPSDAVALALNVTITESSGAGFVTEYPTGQPVPLSSILNVDAANETRAAAGILPVSPSGMSFLVSGGGHIVVDLLGYFTGPSAATGTDGLFTAYDPQRLLDTRGPSPLGTNVPIYPDGGLELATTQGGSIAYNVTSANGDPGFVTAYPGGTAKPSTSTVNSVGGGDIVANLAITQVSSRGLDFYSLNQTHLIVDLEGWFAGPSATITNNTPPTNTPPASGSTGDPLPPAVGPSGEHYSDGCTHEGVDTLNTLRAQFALPPLGVNLNAQIFACFWAIHMAMAFNPANPSGALFHSAQADRDSYVGCPVGENIAFESGTTSVHLFTLWFGSTTHLANILGRDYVGVGNAFIVRTEPNGLQTIWGVSEFAHC